MRKAVWAFLLFAAFALAMSSLHVGTGQSISYSTTVTGALGSPVYALDITVERLL